MTGSKLNYGRAPTRSPGGPASPAFTPTWPSSESSPAASWSATCSASISPPAGQLRAHGIGVRVDLLGVGANLADHGGVDIDCGHAGPARAEPVRHLLATFHSSARPSGEAPDLTLRLSDPRGDPLVLEIDCGLLRPRSRGRARLRSANPAEPPFIELPGLRHPSDAERLAEAYLRGLDVAGRKQIRLLCPGPLSHHRAGVGRLDGRRRSQAGQGLMSDA